MAKRQICVQVDEKVAKRMEEIRDQTGIPVSRQIELKLKGFKIVKDGESTTEIDSKRSVKAVSYTHLTLPTTPYV